MSKHVTIAGRLVGDGEPCFVVAEIGINHNGSVEMARKLIAAASLAGCDAVKFQKRTPEICVPAAQRDHMRETPWGYISYMDYRKRVEFGKAEYTAMDEYAKLYGILWFASCWDEPSVDFMEQFDPPVYKIASACITDHNLMKRHRATGKPLVLSTGMSTMEEIDTAVQILGTDNLVLLHTTSTYPAKNEELNLLAIGTLRDRYRVPVGYSGHEVGLSPSIAARALGACFIERHITLDRVLWGSDQAASVEPQGFARLVRDLRVVEAALGDGEKRVFDSEKPLISRLRRVTSDASRAG